MAEVRDRALLQYLQFCHPTVLTRQSCHFWQCARNRVPSETAAKEWQNSGSVL